MTDLKRLGATSSQRVALQKSPTANKLKRKMPHLSEVLKDYDTSLKPTEFQVEFLVSWCTVGCLFIFVRDNINNER